MKEKIKIFLQSDWTPAEKALLLADILLFGILLGWITSPFKGGLSLLSNNTWDFKRNCRMEEEQDWEEE